MAVLLPGPLALAATRSGSTAGAAHEAAALASLQLLHTALDLDEAAPGGFTELLSPHPPAAKHDGQAAGLFMDMHMP